MVIEVLFCESCNLYGDEQNVNYLAATLPDAKIIKTGLNDTPYFASVDPDMIYIGSMSEAIQRRVIEKLMPLKERLNALIEKGTVILATGNAGEVFCRKIQYVTEKCEAEGLGIFDATVKTDLFDRYNGKTLGTVEDITVVGFRSQFSMIYGDNSGGYFLACQRGIGINKESKLEGLRKNNLICTQVLGPILPLNPLLCEYILGLCGVKAEAAFKEDAMKAYRQRVLEFSDPVVPC